jgi:hypothetical protein
MNAQGRLARAEARAEKARGEYYQAIREAYEAGEPVSLLAQVTVLTRQRIWQIVKEGRS